MTLVVEGLGKTIEDITATLELATATEDISYPGGLVRKGTVAGQHHEWSAWSDGVPLITYHCFWMMGDKLEPQWHPGDIGYKVVMEGDPRLSFKLAGRDDTGRIPILDFRLRRCWV